MTPVGGFWLCMWIAFVIVATVCVGYLGARLVDPATRAVMRGVCWAVRVWDTRRQRRGDVEWAQGTDPADGWAELLSDEAA